jgi:hypothetical protein
VALGLLWVNFGPLYGVLAVKNVEIWELALLAAACLALIRGRRGVAGTCVAAAALTKMLPFVFLPYLMLRDRRTFAYALIALSAILTASHLVYGRDMGWGYLPNLVRAAVGAPGYGFGVNLTWHENVSIRGVLTKAFGYLEKPDPNAFSLYQRGYFVVVPDGWRALSRLVGTSVQAVGLAWTAWVVLRRTKSAVDSAGIVWEWGFLAAMMLVLAPQVSHDYMVLTLGAFSVALAACLTAPTLAGWFDFAMATLLVANVVPRALLSRGVMIDTIIRVAGYSHLTRAEAFQYFGFPLLGLLFLVRLLMRVEPHPPAARAASAILRSTEAWSSGRDVAVARAVGRTGDPE